MQWKVVDEKKSWRYCKKQQQQQERENIEANCHKKTKKSITILTEKHPIKYQTNSTKIIQKQQKTVVFA